MIDSEAITEEKRALGRQLAAYRDAAGLNQHQLAQLIHYGRGPIANVETGRQTCSRTFWERCDNALSANGDLLRGYDEFKALTRQQQAEIAQRMEAATTSRRGHPGATPVSCQRQLGGTPVKLIMTLRSAGCGRRWRSWRSPDRPAGRVTRSRIFAVRPDGRATRDIGALIMHRLLLAEVD